MTGKQITLFSAVCLLLLCAVMPCSATEKTYTFGGRNGWSQVTDRRNIVSGTGMYGYESLMVDTSRPSLDADTDLLLSFDGDCRDDAGNYSITSSSAQVSPSSARGTGSALFWGNGGIRLSGRSGSLFGTEGHVGSFSMSFWLKPLIASNGETVFSWFSSRNLDEYSLFQMITVMVNNNHLEWNFSNIFETYVSGNSRVSVSDENTEVTVAGRSTLIPEVWSFHELTYDDVTGMLEYRVNDRVEDVLFVTADGHERGLLFPAVLGVRADIDICPSYTGYLDSFYITRKNISEPSGLDTFDTSGGVFLTPIFSLDENGADVTAVSVIDSVPAQTQIDYYIRTGSSRYNWTDSYPEWRLFTPGDQLSDVEGMYFQLKARLYPDGTGAVTPSVSEMSVSYLPKELPDPPYSVTAVAGDGYVDITWTSAPGVAGDRSRGYLVYYGERPGEYIGSGAVQGTSPITTGNVNRIRISGLTNGKIYYFAIASYTIGETGLTGPLSKEVYARPSAR